MSSKVENTEEIKLEENPKIKDNKDKDDSNKGKDESRKTSVAFENVVTTDVEKNTGDEENTGNEEEEEEGERTCRKCCWDCCVSFGHCCKECWDPEDIEQNIPVQYTMTEREIELRKDLPPMELVPMEMSCPRCEKTVTTQVEDAAGCLTCIACLIVFFLGGCMGCCLIPFCIPRCMNVDHICPNCDAIIGKYKRIDI